VHLEATSRLHARSKLLGGSCPDQGEEVIGPASDVDGGQGCNVGRLDLDAVGDVHGVKLHRYGHGQHKQVCHITDHPPHNQRVHVRRHGQMMEVGEKKLAMMEVGEESRQGSIYRKFRR
jgi:hypothetical protein